MSLTPPDPADAWSDGLVRGVGISLTDEFGVRMQSAHQGQEIRLLADFDVLGAIGVPLSWFELHNESGQLVHHRWRFHAGEQAAIDESGTPRLRFEHQIFMDVSPGKYTLTVGVSSVPLDVYHGYRAETTPIETWPLQASSALMSERSYRPGAVKEEELQRAKTEHARVICREHFQVGFNRVGQLDFGGVANLRSSTKLTVSSLAADSGPLGSTVMDADGDQPAIVHVTHYKAGSQWIFQVLERCRPDRIVEPTSESAHFARAHPREGWIYPTVYLTRDQFDLVHIPLRTRTFVVIRDLRDTLISGYFSIILTHARTDASVEHARALVSELQKEDALFYLMDGWLAQAARVQLSWLESGARLIHFEDLIEHDLEMFEQILIRDCELSVTPDALRSAVLACRFENMTGGRPRGVEDRASHNRVGVAGDWQNHFTDRVQSAFKARYGGLLVATGYERDLDW